MVLMYVSAIETEIESLCCSQFQQCHFLLKVAESAEEGATCVTSHSSFVPHMDRRVVEMSESELENTRQNIYFCKLLLIFFFPE